MKVEKLSKFTEELLFLYVFGNLEGNFFFVYNKGSFLFDKTSLVEIA